jgi:Flp pilus assembly protein TadG
MMRCARTRLRTERGSVLITGLLLSLALLMIIGTAVDVGHAFIVRRELVSVADDAALSGSQAIDQDALHAGALKLNPEQARSAALRAAAIQPGQRARATATTANVSIEVRQRFPTVLLRLVGLDSLTVSAHATAQPQRP